MTLSYSLDHIPTSTAVDFAVPSPIGDAYLAKLAPLPAVNGESETRYAVISGDTSSPAILTYRSGDAVRKTGTIKRIGSGLSTWARESDSVTGLSRKALIAVNTTFNVPTDFKVEAEDLAYLLVAHMIQFAPDGDQTVAGIASYMSKLLFGVTALK